MFADGLPHFQQLAVIAVMIAAYKALVTVQALHDGKASFLTLEKRVAENIDGIIITNAFVPSADYLLVHLLRIGKRTLVIFEYIPMPKVHIGDVVDHSDSLKRFINLF